MEIKDMEGVSAENQNGMEDMDATFESWSAKDILVFGELGTIPVKSAHSDAYVVVACLEGKSKVAIEGTCYELHPNDIIMCHPNQFIENVMVSYDFKFRALLLSARYFHSIFYFPDKMWKVGLDVMKSPVFHLSDEDLKGFVVNYEMLKCKLARTDMPHYQQIIKLTLQSLIFELYDVLAPRLQLDGNIQLGYSSAEVLFNRFANMLSDESPRRRSVSYYADKLCITPKYLSSVCKKQTGKTASKIIDQLTINYIKQMLHSSEKTIKEIATDIGIDNLSFFGKFVKRELGVSPREYRTNL